MSRSGYSDDCDNEWRMIMWRGQVTSAIKGRRGQLFLKGMAVTLDAMLEKRLIAHELQQNGAYCAIGTVGAARGVRMDDLDPHDAHKIADAFGIARSMVCEIEYINDEAAWHEESPEDRWKRVRAWVADNLKDVTG